MHIQNSMQSEFNPLYIDFIRQLPKYYVYQWNYRLNDFPDKRIYPSESMVSTLKKKILKKYNMNDYS